MVVEPHSKQDTQLKLMTIIQKSMYPHIRSLFNDHLSTTSYSSTARH